MYQEGLSRVYPGALGEQVRFRGIEGPEETALVSKGSRQFDHCLKTTQLLITIKVMKV